MIEKVVRESYLEWHWFSCCMSQNFICDTISSLNPLFLVSCLGGVWVGSFLAKCTSYVFRIGFHPKRGINDIPIMPMVLKSEAGMIRKFCASLALLCAVISVIFMTYSNSSFCKFTLCSIWFCQWEGTSVHGNSYAVIFLSHFALLRCLIHFSDASNNHICTVTDKDCTGMLAFCFFMILLYEFCWNINIK